MQIDDLALTVLATTRDQRACAELALVLEARSIPSRQEFVDGAWVLSVPTGVHDRARAELVDYQRENPVRRPAPRPPRRGGRGWPGVIGYLAVIVLMIVATRQLSFGIDWLGVGRMDAGALRAGEWWRAVTALTLHADAAHLLGNAAFGTFFGYSLARIWGGGFGWLAIVLAGAAGNFLNGLVNGPDHRSIGASTAVFGALGLLTAYSWRRGFPTGASRREKIAPVVAGIGLLAFTGTGGENTDIGAHLLGFVSGFVIACVVARVGPPESERAQIASAALALSIVAGAWAVGVAAS